MRSLRKFILPAVTVLLLASCDHNVSMETTVHEDGSLDKKVIFVNKDSAKNILAIKPNSGWKQTVTATHGRRSKVVNARTDNNGNSYKTEWEKSFPSAEAANAELASPHDSAFRVSSTFEKKFRWFYTYLYYADTYHAINKMTLPVHDYVTPEDYTFINRLPAEKSTISKADSLYLSTLNNKLFEIYGQQAIFEDYYTLHTQLMHRYKLDKKWDDTLRQHKGKILEDLLSERNDNDEFFLAAMEKYHIPLPYEEVRKTYKAYMAPEFNKMTFMQTAANGKYAHRINMPWTIVRSNADSISGNSGFWKPPVIKFLIKDYTMYAEGRKANIWAFAVSAAIVLLTAFVFFKRK